MRKQWVMTAVAIGTMCFIGSFAGCSGGSGSSGSSGRSGGGTQNNISVTINNPLKSNNIDSTNTISLTATVTNDSSNKGVTWNLSGTACSGSACGSLSNSTTTSVNYTAPSNPSSTLGVTITATSVADTTKSAILNLNVQPPPHVTTSTLPQGAVGAAYSSTTLQASGGISPYTWSVTNGSLPAGLSLSTSGTISGTPTASGTSNFTVQVADSGSPALTATASLNIAVNSANTQLAISPDTPVLPGATAGVAYTQDIQASGGVSPYTYTVSAGALPAGLTLSSSTGELSGTPSSADVGTTATFTIQVKDSSQPTALTATQQYDLTIYAQTGTNNSEFNGSYALLAQGWEDAVNDGYTKQIAMAGSITADGNGNITSGLLDLNTDSGASPQVAVTGTYNLGPDNTGILTLVKPDNSTIVLAFAVGAVQGGVANKARFIEFDDKTGIGSTPGGMRQAGEMFLQDKSAFSMSALTGNYAFGFYGETPCPTCASLTSYGPVSAAGVISMSGSGAITNGEADIATGSTTSNAITLSGSYGNPDATTGRVELSISAPSYSIGGWPTNFVAYIVNTQTLLLLSMDSHSASTLVAGSALQQQVSNFTNANLSANAVLSVIGPSSNYVGSFGSSSEASQSTATIGQLTIGTTISITLQQNNSGTLGTKTLSGITYTVGANGRVTLGNAGSGAPVFYLTGTNKGFGTSQPSGTDTPGLVILEPQSGAPFIASSLSGNYMLGVSALPVPESKSLIGELNASSGTATLNVTYNSNANGNLSSTLNPGSQTYTVDANTGLITFADGSVGYVISPTKAVRLENGSSDESPTVQIVEQ